MKFVLESYEDVHRLVDLMLNEHITVDEYWRSIDSWSKGVVYKEIYHQRFKQRSVRVSRC